MTKFEQERNPKFSNFITLPKIEDKKHPPQEKILSKLWTQQTKRKIPSTRLRMKRKSRNGGLFGDFCHFLQVFSHTKLQKSHFGVISEKNYEFSVPIAIKTSILAFCVHKD